MLEELYNSDDKQKFDLLICGTLYVIDLQLLVQYRKDLPMKRRKIRRDIVYNIPVKGTAGIRLQ